MTGPTRTGKTAKRNAKAQVVSRRPVWSQFVSPQSHFSLTSKRCGCNKISVVSVKSPLFCPSETGRMFPESFSGSEFKRQDRQGGLRLSQQLPAVGCYE